MNTDLEQEISTARLQIAAESVSMTVSELTNLYREGTLLIRPEFQRLFRWSNEQKSRLVESILLGIPLPSLFMAQSEDGKWDLVDGLQRVSTLLQLQGLLQGQDGLLSVPLQLTATKFLPHLDGRSWEGDPSLSNAQKLDIRLSRLDIRVLKRSSDEKAKFDLFQRLNSFGSPLTPQEIRSAMIAGENSEALGWLVVLSRRPSFVESVSLSDRLIDEQYDLELVLRFLMLHGLAMPLPARLKDFGSVLDDWSLALAAEWNSRHTSLAEVFEQTFDFIAAHGGEDVFRKWNPSQDRHTGSFSNTAFEVIALGLGYHLQEGTPHRSDLDEASRLLWTLPTFTTRFATGLGTYERLKRTVAIGRKLMADPPREITAGDLSGA